MLKGLDRDVRKKFGVSLSSVIDDPTQYMNEKGFAVKLSRINDYVEKETGRMLEQARGTARAVNEGLAKSDDLTRKVGGYISSHARQNNVPLVKPAGVELSVRGSNRFYISDMDDSTTKFIERLVESSSFVVDMTKSYDNLRMGAWLFSGDRNHIVAVHAPKSSVLLLMTGRAEILQRLREAGDSIKGL
jgi:hypothetical protein